MSRRLLAWTSWGSAVALVAGSFVLAGANLGRRLSLVDELVLPLQAVAFATIGLIVALRRPDNAVGWLFVAVGLFAGAYSFSTQYQTFALVTHPGSLPAGEAMAWVQAWIYVPALATFFTFVPLLFPTGRLPSPRWRPVVWLSALGLIGVCLVDALAPGRIAQTTVVNPFGVHPTIYALLEGVWIFLFGPATVLSVAALITRFRRATGDERQQLKWFAFAAALLPVMWLSWVVVDLAGMEGSVIDAVEIATASVAFLGLPAAAGIAILKYRLYAIDVVINRTLVYGSLTATLALAYVVGVVLLQGLLSPLTPDSGLAVAGSTLAVAALFRPALARIQGFIDRRFYRAKYDAARTLEAFSSRLRDEIDLDALSDELLGVVRYTMQPAHASLWLRRASRPVDGIGGRP